MEFGPATPTLYDRIRHPLSSRGVLTQSPAQTARDLTSEVSDDLSKKLKAVKTEVVDTYEKAVEKIRTLVNSTVDKLQGKADGAAQIVKEYVNLALFGRNGLFTKIIQWLTTAFYYLKAALFTVLAILFTTTIALIAIVLNKIRKVEKLSGRVLGGLLAADIKFSGLVGKRPVGLMQTPLEELEEK
jgi:hypothetical protein